MTPEQLAELIVEGLRYGRGCAHTVVPHDDDDVHRALHAARDLLASHDALAARVRELEGALVEALGDATGGRYKPEALGGPEPTWATLAREISNDRRAALKESK